MYKSPIIIDKIAEQLLGHQDDMILAYIRTIGIHIDKDELVKALQYDRDQYDKGYRDGKAAAAEWIPTSERLPEDRREVLVTAYWHETYQVMMASYYGDGLWWCVPFNNCGKHMQRLKPIAWMPLFIKPYKAESEE